MNKKSDSTISFYDATPIPVSGHDPFRCAGEKCDALLQSCNMFRFAVICPKCGFDNGYLALEARGLKP